MSYPTLLDKCNNIITQEHHGNPLANAHKILQPPPDKPLKHRLRSRSLNFLTNWGRTKSISKT